MCGHGLETGLILWEKNYNSILTELSLGTIIFTDNRNDIVMIVNLFLDEPSLKKLYSLMMKSK